MPLSPKEKKFLASNRNALLQSTRQQEVRGLQLRTKKRIEALYEQERERNRRALLKEKRIVQRALFKEQSDYFLIVICIIVLAFSAAVLLLQHCYLNRLKDNNSF
jgi:hypothetical protein